MDKRRAAAAVGRVVGQRYRLERLLGAGAMGAVYEVSDLQRPGQPLAVKVLDAEVAEAPDTVGRFRREARISADIGHPHAVTVHDFAEDDDGTPYLVMELLQGRDLEQALEAQGPLDPVAAVAVARQVGAALAVGHNRGIVHRDLKPPNIFLCADSIGEDGGTTAPRAKVLDFGIAKIVGSASVMTKTTATMGTPSYMAPEQAEGRSAEVDARTDVYALAVIVYEMLAGRAPFVAESVPSVLYKVIHQEPPPLRGLRADLPAQLDAVLLRALAKRPEERYGSMQALVEALEGALRAAGLQPAPGPELAPLAAPGGAAGRSTAATKGGRGAVVVLVVAAAVVIVAVVTVVTVLR